MITKWDKWREKHWFLCYNLALGIAFLIVIMIVAFMNIFGVFKGILYSIVIIGILDIIGIYLIKQNH